MAITQSKLFQHTAARKRLPEAVSLLKRKGIVSTHSRAEAAAYTTNKIEHRIASFNTQPRGGGCQGFIDADVSSLTFQHTTARRRLLQ